MIKLPAALASLCVITLLWSPAARAAQSAGDDAAPAGDDDAAPAADDAAPAANDTPAADDAAPVADDAAPAGDDDAAPASDDDKVVEDEPAAADAQAVGDDPASDDGTANAAEPPASKDADTAGQATAQPLIGPPSSKPKLGKFSLRYTSLNGGRYNPLGLISSNTIGFRYRLYDSDNPFLKNNFAGVSLLPTVSGGFSRFGALAELQPLSVMRLWAKVEAFYYYGIFNLFQSFPDASSDYSDSKQRELGQLEVGDKRRNYPTVGTQISVGMDLQIKVGPVVARSFSRLVRSDFNTRAGDRVFYEQLYDVLAPNRGVYGHNDTDLLGYLDLSFLNLLDGMRVVGGLRNSVTIPVYTDAHFAPDNVDRTSDDIIRRTFGDTIPIWRLGPLLSFTLYDKPGWAFNTPTVFIGAQWHILHRWRAGADTSIFIPYTFFGFSFKGDLLT